MVNKKSCEYLPFLDGLRAIAVGLVIIFHYWSNELLLPGGFVGVDVFFVISGFIITRSLIADCEGDTFSLRSFWIRRSKRLMPAVSFFLVMLIGLSVALPSLRGYMEESIYAWFVPYIPDLDGELAVIREQIVAVLLYYTNWQFIANDVSYFEQMGRPSLLTHLWSLAIEEQFYIIWPALLSLFVFMCKKRRGLVAVCVSMPLILSVILMAVLGQAAPHDARAYYGTDCRAFALLLGALLAVFWDRWREDNFTVWQKCFFHVIGPCGLVIIGYLSYTLIGGESFAFQGGLLGASIGTIMVIMAGKWHRSVVSRVLQNRVLLWIGKRSYGLYLWHWPVFILTDPAYNYPLDGVSLVLLRMVLLFGIVEFSYKFIELPIRNGEIFMKCTQSQTVFVKYAGVALASLMLIFSSAAVVTAKSDNGPYGHAAAKKAQKKADEQPSMEIVLDDKQPETDVSNKSDAESGHVETVSDSTKDSASDTAEKPAVRDVEKPVIAKMENRKTDKKSKTVSEPILAIGDSVMLGAKTALESNITGAYVDAKVGRQFSTVLEMVRSLKAQNKIPSTVVIHSGTNGTIDERQLVQLMDLLSSCKRVVVVNNYMPRSWQKPNNEILARIVPQYQNAQLVNWYDVCLGHKQLLYKDGIHIGGIRGAELYASVIKSAL